MSIIQTAWKIPYTLKSLSVFCCVIGQEHRGGEAVIEQLGYEKAVFSGGCQWRGGTNAIHEYQDFDIVISASLL